MNTAMDNLLRRHRITVDEYYRMAEIGLIAPDARVELIEGEIIDMGPIGDLHGGTVVLLDEALQRALAGHAMVRCQASLRLNNASQPQPDIAVVRRRDDHYRRAHPTARETLLIIEVSDTSLRYDREVKLPLYARHGVPEVWIVDLRSSKLYFYRSLLKGAYATVSFTGKPGITALAALPGVTVDLSGLFLS